MPVKVKLKIDHRNEVTSLPAIALRGLVIFPNNVVHFEVGRPQSIAAVEWAMENNANIFLVAQKDMDVEDPKAGDLYPYGVIAEIKQALRVSNDLVKVLVESKSRAKLVEVDYSSKFMQASIKQAPLRGIKSADSVRIEALLRSIREAFEDYMSLSPRIPKDVVYTIISSEDPVFLAEYIPSNLLFKYTDKQRILNENTITARLEALLAVFSKENKVLSVEKEIQDKVSTQMEKNQRDYFLREQMRAISNELDEEEDTKRESDDYKDKIAKLPLPEEARDKLNKEADRLARMQGNSQEASVIRTYLTTCLELPWAVSTPENIDINKAEAILNRDHYGLKKVKERILEILAVRKLTDSPNSQIICLVGPPGVGKTSIANSIARCLGRKYGRVSLGGVRDEAEIRGHRRTYIGAMPGKLISAISTTKSNNPVLLLDEVDKMAADFRGDPAAALLEALDPEQNVGFKDLYLDIPFDLSKVLFITTANTTDTIPHPLLDRMDVIQLPSYTRVEKFHIAKRHLLPKQLIANGLKGKVRFTDSAIHELIDSYTQEAGVRGLERVIGEVLRKCAKSIAAGETEKEVSISNKNLEELIGPVRVKPNFSNKTNAVGIANGLAWTSIGGELLPIEVQIIENGSGSLELTGSLGEVMKESAKLAITYAKVHAAEYGFEGTIFKNIDIHIHAPEGAIPKDGPSAGVTLATALISALSGRPVRSNIAMTGEITLHGLVLPIGGLKEKTMAAYREKMKTVLLPADNVSDLYDVDQVVKDALEFQPVSDLKAVLKLALLPKKE